MGAASARWSGTDFCALVNGVELVDDKMGAAVTDASELPSSHTRVKVAAAPSIADIATERRFVFIFGGILANVGRMNS